MSAPTAPEAERVARIRSLAEQCMGEVKTFADAMPEDRRSAFLAGSAVTMMLLYRYLPLLRED